MAFEFLKNIISLPFEYFKGSIHDPGSSTTAQSEIPSIQRYVNELNSVVTTDDVNKAMLQTPPNPRFCLPVNNYITSQFGWRIHPTLGTRSFHTGLDMSCWGTFGAPVKVPEDGVVVGKAAGAAGITYVSIKGDYSGCYHYLMHVGSKTDGVSPLTWVGHRVKAGFVIGYTNRTGRLTGPHLHYTIYTKSWVCIDPMCFFRKYAPELAAQIQRYVDTGDLEPNNKTGSKCADV